MGVGPSIHMVLIDAKVWKLLQRNGLNSFARSLTILFPFHFTLMFSRPHKVHTPNSWKHTNSASKGEMLASGTLIYRDNKAGGSTLILSKQRTSSYLQLPSGHQSSPKGGTSLINIITQASCLESLHMENCILQSVEAAKSPAESIDFYFNDVCDQYLNRIDRACC